MARKRVRIKTGNTTVGRPGFKTKGADISQVGGGRVSKTKASKRGVRRLIAKNPANGRSANIGTERDLGRFTNSPVVPNTTATPSPRILRAPVVGKNAVAKGVKRVVNRSTNRRVRKLK